MILIDRDKETVLATDIEIADSFWSRFRGLMLRRGFNDGEALLFDLEDSRKFGVHTFFVFFPIDLVYLDRNMEVVEIKESLTPWSTYSPAVESSFLVELPAGKAGGIEEGDRLEVLRED